MIEVKFGPWLPDVTDHNNPGLEVAENVIPGPEGYQPARGASTVVENALAANATSARTFVKTDGTRLICAAHSTDLYVINSSGAYTSGLGLTLTEYVQFVQFGTEIYATEKGQGFWKITDIDSDTTFASVAGTNPQGRAMARIADFLVMGNLTDIDTFNRPYRVRWSPFNNPSGTWTTDIGTQSDFVDMPHEYGMVMAIAGGSYGLIFQRYGVSRMYYTGGSVPFAKELIDRERGCASTASVVSVGDKVYFLSDDGFFVTDGGPAQSISRGRVWKWFLDNAGQTFLDKCVGAVDWTSRCVIWQVPGPDGEAMGLLYYNWETDWWSFVRLAVDLVFTSSRAPVTLDALDDPPYSYTNIDTMGPSLDSPDFRGGGRSVAVFIDGYMRQLSGDTLEAVMTTGEFQVLPGRRAFVSEVVPLITNGDENTCVSIGGRDRQTETIVYTADVATGPDGFAAFNVDSRYFRLSFCVPAATDWRDAYGFQMEARPAGHS